MFVFSDIGLLVLSVIGFSSWLFTFRIANAGTGEDPFMHSITSPECHIYKWGGSRKPGLLTVQFLETFFVTSRRWVARRDVTTSRRFNVTTSILPFSGMSRREIRTSRR